MPSKFSVSYENLLSANRLARGQLDAIRGYEDTEWGQRIRERADKLRVGVFATATEVFFDDLQVDKFSPHDIIRHTVGLHNIGLALPHSIGEQYAPADEIIRVYDQISPDKAVELRGYLPSQGTIAGVPELQVVSFGPYRVPYGSVLFDVVAPPEVEALRVRPDFNVLARDVIIAGG